MKPLRFLMLNWRDPENPLAGGAERVTQRHMAELVRRGHEVIWFANDFEDAETETVIDCIRIIRGGGRGSSILHARRCYHEHGPFDLVIDQHHGLPWFAPWWSSSNCIAYIHEVLGPIWHAFYGHLNSAIGKTQERLFQRLYAGIQFWTVSESTRQQLLDHGVRDVHVWPNGTDTEPLPTLPAKRLAKPLRLIALARLAPNKRVDHVVRTLALLREQGCESELTIIGWGQDEWRLEAQVDELGLSHAVTFAGRLDDAEKNVELQKAHLLLHTSMREGWGLNVIEANAMGTPAVVYPVGGLVDSTVHWQTGLVSEAETPESLAKAVIGLANDPTKYDAMRTAAWERSFEFRWESVLRPTCDWLENMARGETPT